MFTWLNKQGVRSDSGFSIQSIDRFTILYEDHAKQLSVFVERGLIGGTKACVIVQREAFARWDSGDPIPIEQQHRIQKNFTDAMEFQGVAVELY